MRVWQIMYMSDLKRKLKLLRLYDDMCIVCGREFAHVASATKEHIIPRSVKARTLGPSNIAPSHFRCNNLRGTDSLIVAAKRVDLKLLKITERVGREAAHCWLNKVIPGRLVPPEAMLSPAAARRELHW